MALQRSTAPLLRTAEKTPCSRRRDRSRPVVSEPDVVRLWLGRGRNTALRIKEAGMGRQCGGWQELGHPPGDAAGLRRRVPGEYAHWVKTVPHPGPDATDRLAAIEHTTRDAAGLAQCLAARGLSGGGVAARWAVRGERPGRQPGGVCAGRVGVVWRRVSASARASSHCKIHVGYLVRSCAGDAFWRDRLGFKPFLHESENGTVGDDHVSQQVPDGTDWLEYVMHAEDEHLRMHGMMNPFAGCDGHAERDCRAEGE